MGLLRLPCGWGTITGGRPLGSCAPRGFMLLLLLCGDVFMPSGKLLFSGTLAVEFRRMFSGTLAVEFRRMSLTVSDILPIG